MSDTPETDAKASPHIGFFSCATVPAEFARRLERERDAWRECAEHLAEALKFWVGEDSYQIGGHHESRVALASFRKLKEAAK